MRKIRSLVAFTAVALATIAAGQQPEPRVPRVVFLSPTSSPGGVPLLRRALVDLGRVEGRDFTIEALFADGRAERFPQIAAEGAARNPDVLAMVGAITARAAMKATSRIPIVFAVVVDPVADHLVADLQHPGGNVTGVTSYDPGQARRQLAILKQVVPGLKRVAILGDAAVSEALLTANEAAARELGLLPQRLRIAAPTPDVEGALAAARRERAGALVALEEPAVVMVRKRIAELANRDRLPTMFAPDWMDSGGLLGYGTSVLEASRRMATFVDRILRGARPGDLPVEQVTASRLIVNQATARAIGVAIPADLLKRADRVLE